MVDNYFICAGVDISHELFRLSEDGRLLFLQVRLITHLWTEFNVNQQTAVG